MRMNQSFNHILSFCSLLFLCSSSNAAELQKGTGETDGYRIVWQDLFDHGELDSSAWNIEVRNDGCGNNELQYYTTENVTVAPDSLGNGCLIITAKMEEYGGLDFTSGRITSQGKVSFCHGKIEASIKLPKTANGLWPAFWLLGENIESASWPACGEIDILEMGHADGIRNNCQDRYFNGACHWGYYENGGYPNYGKSSIYNYSLQDGEFHLFTLYWDNEKVAMYVDQDKYPNVAPYYEMLINDKSSNMSPGNYFHHDFFLLFNLAVGGNFPQLYNKEEITALQQSEAKMYVNFVKVYQKGEDGDDIIYPKSEETSLKQITSTECPIENNFIYDINGRLLESNYKNSSNNILIIKRDNSSEKIIMRK